MFKSNKYKRLESDYNQLGKEYGNLKSRLVSLFWYKEQAELIDNLLEKYQILGIAENRQGHKYYVCLDTPDNSVNITLRSNERDKDIPRIDTNIYYDENDRNKEKFCYIIDLFAINENIGNGSILLDYLCKYLKQMDIRKVTGQLAPRDTENFDKLEYFYKKNGFKVTFYKDKDEIGANIEKLL